MSDERIFIAKKVANQLFAVETAIEAALTAAAEFTASLPQARAQAKLSATVGQDVFDATLATLASLNDARRNIVAVHTGLDETRLRMGMRTVGFGSLDKLPSPWGQTELKAVA